MTWTGIKTYQYFLVNSLNLATSPCFFGFSKSGSFVSFLLLRHHFDVVRLRLNNELLPRLQLNTVAPILSFSTKLVFVLVNKREIGMNVQLCCMLQYGEYFMLNDLLMFFNDCRYRGEKSLAIFIEFSLLAYLTVKLCPVSMKLKKNLLAITSTKHDTDRSWLFSRNIFCFNRFNTAMHNVSNERFMCINKRMSRINQCIYITGLIYESFERWRGGVIM